MSDAEIVARIMSALYDPPKDRAHIVDCPTFEDPKADCECVEIAKSIAEEIEFERGRE